MCTFGYDGGMGWLGFAVRVGVVPLLLLAGCPDSDVPTTSGSGGSSSSGSTGDTTAATTEPPPGQTTSIATEGADQGSTSNASTSSSGDSESGNSTDEGTTNTGTSEGGSTDEGTTDTGSTDEGTTDTGTSEGGSTDEGSSGTSSCEPPDNGASIGQDCFAAPCPDGYTCQPFVGFVFQLQCQILCTEDCECPEGLTCNATTDKTGVVWHQCG